MGETADLPVGILKPALKHPAYTAAQVSIPKKPFPLNLPHTMQHRPQHDTAGSISEGKVVAIHIDIFC